MGKRIKLTAEDLDFIRNRFPDTPTRHIAQLIGVSTWTVYRTARDLGVKKSRGYLESIHHTEEAIESIPDGVVVPALSGGYDIRHGNVITHRME